MNQRDNFAGGFFWGAVFGGVVGGALGALLASGRLAELVSSEEASPTSTEAADKPLPRTKKRALQPGNRQADIEAARRGLEDKIAQLNDAIDDVRQKLGNTNGAPVREGERSTLRDR